MTAITVMAGRDAAWIMADRAWFTSDGTLDLIQPKIVVYQRLLAAIAVAGQVSNQAHGLIGAWLRGRKGQDEAIGRLPDLFDILLQNVRNEPDQLRLFMVIWSTARNQAEAHILKGDGKSVVQVRACASPPTDAPVPERLSDHAAAVAFIEGQRRWQFPGGCRIGGAVDLVTITASGMTGEIIHRWPDRIGEPIAIQPARHRARES